MKILTKTLIKTKVLQIPPDTLHPWLSLIKRGQYLSLRKLEMAEGERHVGNNKKELFTLQTTSWGFFCLFVLVFSPHTNKMLEVNQ